MGSMSGATHGILLEYAYANFQDANSNGDLAIDYLQELGPP